MNFESILSEASGSRTGYEVAYFRDAGMPVYVLTLRILVLESKPIGPIDEAILRSLKAGVDNADDIYLFLGLNSMVIDPILAKLNRDELINYTREMKGAKACISLSIKGKAILSSCSIVRPVERTLKVCMDALTRKLLFINPEQLLKPKEMKEEGLFEIPSCNLKRPEKEDISLDEFDRFLRKSKANESEKKEILAVKLIERREVRYVPYIILFYRNISKRSEIEVSFWNDEGISFSHEAIFRESGGPLLIGAETFANNAPIYPDSYQSNDGFSPQDDSLGNLSSPSFLSEVNRKNRDTLESVLCYQHPILLKKALQTAKERLLIISPWINHQVVNGEFINLLESALNRGVDVYIGYGIDGGGNNKSKHGKQDITPQAKEKLDRLSNKFKNFHFVYIGNTHRKSLVCDDLFSVTTSFNWLSFKGDGEKYFRDERGFLVNKKNYVDLQFLDDLKLLTNGYHGAPK